MSLRRLPIYLVLDCSESMAGEAVAELERGLRGMVEHLQTDPHAIETACLSVVTFSGGAEQLVPLTEVLDFRVPKLAVRSGSSLGAGLRVLMDCVRREVRRTTATEKGDYKPLVILFSDGQPTDDYGAVAAELRRASPGVGNVYAIGCGPDADFGTLREVTDIVLRMADLSPDVWRKVFVWLSASVSNVSQAVGGEGARLPELPAGALEVPPVEGGPYVVRQVFLHARCQRGGHPYLMRYARRGRSDVFVALGAHKLEVVEQPPDTGRGERISTARLEGVPPCPYCDNPVAVACSCGALVCLDPRASSFACPACGQSGAFGGAGSGFEVARASG